MIRFFPLALLALAGCDDEIISRSEAEDIAADHYYNDLPLRNQIADLESRIDELENDNRQLRGALISHLDQYNEHLEWSEELRQYVIQPH